MTSRGRSPTAEEVEDWLRFSKTPASPAGIAGNPEVSGVPDGGKKAGVDATTAGWKATGRALERSEEQDWADFVEGRPLGSGEAEAGKEAVNPPDAGRKKEAATRGHAQRARSGSTIDRKLARRLNSGRAEPQRIIDLHGLDRNQAERNLKRFLNECRAARVRLALVISGKGNRSRDEESFRCPGVLRKSVPVWLGQKPLSDIVQHFQGAHAVHGGSGAFYVYLRQERNQAPGRQ